MELNLVDVMDEMIYNSLSRYYHVLEKKGYMSYDHMVRLLVLIFYKEFVYNDYRGLLSREDYRLIERALDCLYGSTCLIPYPDYLKMGKLHIGETTEMAHRIEALENEPVLKLVHDLDSVDNPDIQSDVILVSQND